VVLRSHLIERLNAGLHRKLTLIAAPAGCGKTTLLSAWVAGLQARGTHVAWFSLEEGDSDPARFLTYLVAALRTVEPHIGEGALGLLQSHSSSQPPPTEAILTALLNEIATLSHNFALILDDYHVIDSQVVDDASTFLIEHLPPQMHLVIASREDPPLPLPRLRVRDQVTELRARDLRFTLTEAAGFLQAMNLNLSMEDIAALEARTEGWIAGLQLAALSLQSHQDASGFIRAFAGENRYIVDYLVEEVLQRQPESVRSFLVQTSILDRLYGPLCDAVTGHEEGAGKARLEALERGNFFVVPLDDKRHWYRYHHLFAEVLSTYLGAEQPDLAPTLHRRASQWYEQNDSATDAIRHALAAEDFGRAANLVELTMSAMRSSRQTATLLGWLKALPDEVVRVRPVISVVYAHVLLSSGELEGVEERLRDAERWLDSSVDMADERTRPDDPPARMVVVDDAVFRRLPVEIAVARAGLALHQGHVADTVKYAQQVLDLVPDDDLIGRGGAVAFLGLALWASGDLEAGRRAFSDGLALVQRAGFISDVLNGVLGLADIRTAQGCLQEAMHTYEQALKLAARTAAEQGVPALLGAADIHVGMSELERERNDLDAATQHLLRSKELGEQMGLPQNRYRWSVAMSRIREAKGDLDGALDLLHESERLYVRDFFPNVRPVAALRTRVWVAQGRLVEALDWAREQGLSAEDDLNYLREFEHITLARVLLARYKGDRAERPVHQAMGLLERLLKAAEEGGRAGSAIEILVLQALAHQAQGDMPAALIPLERALTLAEPEGYVRMFVDEGMPMTQLLLEAAARGIMPDYAGRLMQAFEAEQQGSTDESPHPTSSVSTPLSPALQRLVEPLSQRELEVLRLLGTELTGPEMAGELTVSLNTLRTHTKNIYDKLGVNNRRAAVRRAEELHLL
jgi:LuxR family maltose regulon positive regulatory protein